MRLRKAIGLGVVLVGLWPAPALAQQPVTIVGDALTALEELTATIDGTSGANKVVLWNPDGSAALTFTDDPDVDESGITWSGTPGIVALCRASSGAPSALAADRPNAAWCGLSGETIVAGMVAHGSAVAGAPVNIGLTAVALNANPSAVDAGDVARALANRAGIPFSGIPHPNILTREWTVTDANGAQTGTALVDIAAGTKIVVLYSKVTCDADNTTDVDFRMAFDTDATFAAAATTGTSGIIDSQPGIGPGGGSIVTAAATGGDGEDVRYSLDDPAGGACRGIVRYFTIDS